MSDLIDFAALCQESRTLCGFGPEDEATIAQFGPLLVPALDEVTEKFYAALLSVPRTAAFLQGRIDMLKRTHRAWLESLFTRPIDAQYTQWMHQIGSVHVRVNLPVEFMTAGMALVQRELMTAIATLQGIDVDQRARLAIAISSLCGFCQLVMQTSYASDRLAAELEKFLKITGMSRTLFDNLAAAYRE
jgi:hypothetical protein